MDNASPFPSNVEREAKMSHEWSLLSCAEDFSGVRVKLSLAGIKLQPKPTSLQAHDRDAKPHFFSIK